MFRGFLILFSLFIQIVLSQFSSAANSITLEDKQFTKVITGADAIHEIIESIDLDWEGRDQRSDPCSVLIMSFAKNSTSIILFKQNMQREWVINRFIEIKDDQTVYIKSSGSTRAYMLMNSPTDLGRNPVVRIYRSDNQKSLSLAEDGLKRPISCNHVF